MDHIAAAGGRPVGAGHWSRPSTRCCPTKLGRWHDLQAWGLLTGPVGSDGRRSIRLLGKRASFLTCLPLASRLEDPRHPRTSRRGGGG
jgi:hypothetical protein